MTLALLCGRRALLAPRPGQAPGLPCRIQAARHGLLLGAGQFDQVPHFRLGSGRDGGLPNAGSLVKSSASNGVWAAKSRAVSAGRFHFSSTSLRTEVWSRTLEQT